MLRSSNRLAIALLASVAFAACVSQASRKSEAGVYEVGNLRVTLDDGWYEQRGADLPDTPARSRTWSREGLEHDRLFITGGVDDGESIFRGSYYAVLPAFLSNMSADDIAEVAAQSLQRVLWNGAARVLASNVRERGFTGMPGFEFELSVDVPGSASQRGIAGGFVEEGRLYLAIFLAEEAGHFERGREAAQAVIDSAVPTMKTIRW